MGDLSVLYENKLIKRGISKMKENKMKRKRGNQESSKASLYLVLILILSSLVFLSGCASYSTPYLFNPYVGTKALQVSFLNNAPPPEVYSGSDYVVGFELDNSGAEDVRHAYMVLGTDDFNGASINQTFLSFDLNGKKTTHGFWGERKFKIIRAKAPKLETKKESTTIITYMVCYPYLTKAQVPVCVDTNPLSPTSKGCNPTPVSLNSQGAPIAVTYVEPSTIPIDNTHVQLRFRIKIENKGQGLAVDRAKYNALCLNKPIDGKDLNSVAVTAQLAGYELDCTPGEVKLVSSETGNTGQFICVSRPMPVKDAYKTLLTVNLYYGYVLSGNKEVYVYNPTLN